MALSGDIQLFEARKNKDPLVSQEADIVSSAVGVGRSSHVTKYLSIFKTMRKKPGRSRRVAGT